MARQVLNAAILGPRKSKIRFAFVMPIIAFLGVSVALGWGLMRDPREIPSALIGKPVPDFALPPVQGRSLGLSSTDLRGEVSLVNVFASWCTACREEHPLFMRLAESGSIPLHGLNYKDRPADAEAWLDTLGDPYMRTGADRNGRVAIDWGVYGVPETYVIDHEGRIVFKHVGPVSEAVLRQKILPIVERLQAASAERKS